MGKDWRQARRQHYERDPAQMGERFMRRIGVAEETSTPVKDFERGNVLSARMTLAFRIIAWLLTAAVTFATLGPPQYRPHLGLSQDGEHALAFVLVGLAFGLAYPRRRLLTAGIAVVLIGVLELVQLAMTGRHARWEGFVVDALGAGAGTAVAA